jgi:hypothetical protein
LPRAQSAAHVHATERKRPEAAVRGLPRGVDGLQLSMPIEQLAQSYSVKPEDDPVASFLARLGKTADAAAIKGRSDAIGKQFFRVSSRKAALPRDATSADVRTITGVVYMIGIHYEDASPVASRWASVSAWYLAQLGNPTTTTESGVSWRDGRTRIDLEGRPTKLTPAAQNFLEKHDLHESSSTVINAFFVDTSLEQQVQRLEMQRNSK